MLRFVMMLLLSFVISIQAIATDLSINEGKELLNVNTKVLNQFSKNRKVVPKSTNQVDEKVIFVKNTIFISPNTIFDGEGKLYIWVGYGNCGQTEGMPPMFNLGANVTLKNLYMAYAPDGIHIRGSNITIDNIINLRVCEDAISTTRSQNPKNINVNNSIFIDCDDKALQFNSGENITITNNKFLNCKQPIRIPRNIKNYQAKNNIMTGVAKHYYLRSKK